MRLLMMVPKVQDAAAVVVLAISIMGSTAASACSFATKPLEVAFSISEQVRALPRGEDTPIAAEIEITALQSNGPLIANVVEVLWGRVDTITLAIWPNGFGCSGAAHRVGERVFIVGRMERKSDGTAYFMATRFPWSSVHTVEQISEWNRRQIFREQKPSASPSAVGKDTGVYWPVGWMQGFVGRMERNSDGTAYGYSLPLEQRPHTKQMSEWNGRQVFREQKPSAPPYAVGIDGMSR